MMKIKQDDYKVLETSMNKFLSDNPTMKTEYKIAGFSKIRLAWDVCTASNIPIDFICNVLYEYLEDSHIQTALLKIVGEY